MNFATLKRHKRYWRRYGKRNRAQLRRIGKMIECRPNVLAVKQYKAQYQRMNPLAQLIFLRMLKFEPKQIPPQILEVLRNHFAKELQAVARE